MKTAFAAAFALLLAGAASAATGDAAASAPLDPCVADPGACADSSAVRPTEGQPNEPVVIFLDAEGQPLVRMPLSKFRKAHPDAALPADLESDLR